MGDLSVYKHMEMICIRLHGGQPYIEFSHNGKEHFPDRVDKYSKNIPGTDTFIVTGKEDTDNCNDEA